jgi:ribosome biogenesis GTPase
MHAVTDLSMLGWTTGRAAALPAGCLPARVSRVDRGRLRVLTADGEHRVHPVAALYDESGLAGPAVGDSVAVRGELAVAVLPRTSAFIRTVAGRMSAAQVVAANLDTVLLVVLTSGPGCAASTVRCGSSPTASGSPPAGPR